MLVNQLMPSFRAESFHRVLPAFFGGYILHTFAVFVKLIHRLP